MSNISYSNEHRRDGRNEPESRVSENGPDGNRSRDNAPTPPNRYVPQQGQPTYTNFQGDGPGPDAELQSARRMASIAQIMSLVSLIIGGVVLSMAALIVAIAAYRRAQALMVTTSPRSQEELLMLKRSTTAAIAMAAGALAINAITLIAVYPMVMEMLQSNDFSSVLNGSSDSASISGSGTSTWG